MVDESGYECATVYHRKSSPTFQVVFTTMAKLEAAPPHYYSNFTDLYRHIAANVKQANVKVWMDEQKKFHDAVDAEMTKDLNGESLKQEMDQLQASSNTIKQVFNDVSSGLQTVHNTSQHEDFKSGVRELKKRWDKFKPAGISSYVSPTHIES
jgi:hypothetical protein